MAKCIHSFIKTGAITKGSNINGVAGMRGISGAVVVCAECGEVRKIFEDGIVGTVVKGKDIDERMDDAIEELLN